MKSFSFPIILCVLIQPAFSGVDNTFLGVFSLFGDWISGSLGKVIAGALLLVGVGVGMVKGSVKTIAVDFAAAMACIYFPELIDVVFAATA